MTQAEIYTAVPEHLPKNFPFYNWVPKPLGIAFLVILFIPIMTVSGAYTVNSSEMVGGLGIQSEHIAFISFVTSIGMAAFSPFFYSLVSVRRQKMMSLVGFSILAVQSYIEEHFAEPLSISDLAGRVFMTPCYLTHRFKDATGYSPKQYLVLHRIAYAKELLAESSLPVSEVAFRAGFTDVNNFIRTFKRDAGDTPLRYRETHQQTQV